MVNLCNFCHKNHKQLCHNTNICKNKNRKFSKAKKKNPKPHENEIEPQNSTNVFFKSL